MGQGALLKFVAAYIGVMVAPFVVVGFLAATVPNEEHLAQWVLWGIPLYVGFAGYSFFFLQDRLLFLAADASVVPLSQQELLSAIRRVYAAPELHEAFELFEQGDTLSVCWAAHQPRILGAWPGGASTKRVYVLALDQRHAVARVLVKEKDVEWSASERGLDFSFAYMQGYSVEWRVQLSPAIEVLPDGRLHFSIEKLRYDSEEIWGPLQRIVTGAGWRIQVDMLPRPWMRAALIAGIVALALPFSFVRVGTPSVQPAAASEAPQAGTPEAALAALRQRVVLTPTPLLSQLLRGLMQQPAEGLHPFVREEFRIYAEAYARRADADPSFKEEVRRYAALLSR